MTRKSVGLAVAVLVLAWPLVALAVDDWIHVTGALLPSGSFQMGVVPASYSDNAILIHTEPSHTLLVAVIDTAFAQTSEGQSLAQQILAEGAQAFVVADLPQSNFSITIDGPPPTDTRVTAVIYGTVVGADFNLFDGTIPDIFHFDIDSLAKLPPLPATKWMHCVTCTPCGKMCVECDGPRFTANCVNCTINCG